MIAGTAQIAIIAEDLITRGKTFLLQPAIKQPASPLQFSIFSAWCVNMVNCQKQALCFSTASTSKPTISSKCSVCDFSSCVRRICYTLLMTFQVMLITICFGLIRMVKQKLLCALAMPFRVFPIRLLCNLTTMTILIIPRLSARLTRRIKTIGSSPIFVESRDRLKYMAFATLLHWFFPIPV